jgi:hypothetical protein
LTRSKMPNKSVFNFRLVIPAILFPGPAFS